ncbi:ATP-binding protein [Oceanospirillum sediminis]|uniref:histidine kinase n=1 Tax=Oceanospirillum sediminis TaxID=2760088 RepID=A0A839IUU4_9GAMM|nr:ATP-binding protein [Oceanospirillum sediminis]MBB1488197.1 hypothetical protein [Oceanospirillum sediminis]
MMIKKNFSIKAIAWILGIFMITSSLLGVFITYLAADEEFNEVLEDDLKQNAALLNAMVVATKATPAELRIFLKEHVRMDDEDTIWVTVYHTQQGWQVSNFDHYNPLQKRGSSFIETRFQGYGWYGYQHDEDELIVQMYRRDDLSDDIIGDIAEDITAPTLIGSALSLLLLSWLVRLIIKPLTLLSRELDQRSGDDLSPLKCDSQTREIKTLTNKLNRLMSEVDEVLNRERQFANDVAHELRTPLTTIKLELSCPDPDISAIKLETERVNRIVEQLLTLARLEQHHWKKRFEPIALDTRIQAITDKYQRLFKTRGIALHLELEPCHIEGDATLLQVLIENIFSNILRHSPRTTEVNIALTRQTLSIKDNGDGVTDTLLDAIRNPAVRLDSKGEGLGLGLAICQRIAAIHQASFHCSHACPGLHITLCFTKQSSTSG